jgi:hypothetical protein
MSILLDRVTREGFELQIRIYMGLRDGVESGSSKWRDMTTPFGHLGFLRSKSFAFTPGPRALFRRAANKAAKIFQRSA